MTFILWVIFRPSFAVKTTLSRPHIFSMGENKDGRKKGQILKQWTYTGNRLQRETNMAPKIPKDSSYLMSVLEYTKFGIRGSWKLRLVEPA